MTRGVSSKKQMSYAKHTLQQFNLLATLATMKCPENLKQETFEGSIEDVMKALEKDIGCLQKQQEYEYSVQEGDTVRVDSQNYEDSGKDWQEETLVQQKREAWNKVGQPLPHIYWKDS